MDNLVGGVQFSTHVDQVFYANRFTSRSPFVVYDNVEYFCTDFTTGKRSAFVFVDYNNELDLYVAPSQISSFGVAAYFRYTNAQVPGQDDA